VQTKALIGQPPRASDTITSFLFLGLNRENVAPNIATTLASTLEEPVPGWKGHFGGPPGPSGPGGGPGPVDNPAPSFSTPHGPSTPTGPPVGMPAPGTPGFSGSFHGPSPGPPHTPGGGPPQLVPCGPPSGPQGASGGSGPGGNGGPGYLGSPAGNSGSSTPGPCGPPLPASTMSSGPGGGPPPTGPPQPPPGMPLPPVSCPPGGGPPGPPVSMGPIPNCGPLTPNNCGPPPPNNFQPPTSHFNGIGSCGPCVPNSPSNCGPPPPALRGQSPSRPGSSGPPYVGPGSPFPFGPNGPPPPGMMGPGGLGPPHLGPIPGGPPGPPPHHPQFMGPPGPPSFGSHGPPPGMHPAMSPHGPLGPHIPPHGPPPHGPLGPHCPPPPFMDRMDPGFRPSRRPLPMPQPDYRIHEMNKRLQQRTDDSDNLWWDAFATEFFEDDANLTLTFCLEDGPKRYSIGRTLIPRYFRSIFEGGVTDLRYELRHPKESFHNTSITMDCDQCVVATLHGKPMFTKVYTEGRLIVEFTFDDMMRIRSWHFAVRNHRELIPRSILAMQEPGMIESLSKNITRQGLTNTTLNYLRLCVILEPMQELMSRHKAYALSPRDCLKTTLFQKWQKMVAPPETSRPTKNRRKRKGAAGGGGGTASGPTGTLGSKKRSPGPNFSLASQDVMVVGEPSLMGGEFGEEDERLISRLENAQYDPAAQAAQAATQGPPPPPSILPGGPSGPPPPSSILDDGGGFGGPGGWPPPTGPPGAPSVPKIEPDLKKSPKNC